MQHQQTTTSSIPNQPKPGCCPVLSCLGSSSIQPFPSSSSHYWSTTCTLTHIPIPTILVVLQPDRPMCRALALAHHPWRVLSSSARSTIIIIVGLNFNSHFQKGPCGSPKSTTQQVIHNRRNEGECATGPKSTCGRRQRTTSTLLGHNSGEKDSGEKDDTRADVSTRSWGCAGSSTIRHRRRRRCRSLNFEAVKWKVGGHGLLEPTFSQCRNWRPQSESGRCTYTYIVVDRHSKAFLAPTIDHHHYNNIQSVCASNYNYIVVMSSNGSHT